VFVALAFVLVWMALGFLVRLDANSYVLVGLPITGAFQCFVARRPLTDVWIRDAGAGRVDAQLGLMAAFLAAYPIAFTIRAVHRGAGAASLWGVAAIGGAGAAAFALRNRRGALGRETARSVATAGVVGIGIVMLLALLRTKTGIRLEFNWGTCLRSFALYFPVCFAVEEVTFRGALDSYVASTRSAGYGSAVYVSALWGIWHLPLIARSGHPSPIAAFFLLAVHVPIGILLSSSWRRSGNLVAPAAAHALIDAVRNALLGTF
jgi:membrane protease YdiL (CAAX protease family)